MLTTRIANSAFDIFASFNSASVYPELTELIDQHHSASTLPQWATTAILAPIPAGYITCDLLFSTFEIGKMSTRNF